MTDFASIAEATAAGYIRTQCDKGAGASELRYTTVLEKRLVGDAGQGVARAYGECDSSANAADPIALAALNVQRAWRYAGTGSHGGSMTEDVT
jgi:hypothetical protein